MATKTVGTLPRGREGQGQPWGVGTEPHGGGRVLTIWGGGVVGAILCNEGCLAVPLVSTH